MQSKLRKLASVYRSEGIFGAFAALGRFVFRPRFWIKKTVILPLSRKFPTAQSLSRTRVHGYRMYLNPFDEGISVSLQLHGIYEPMATSVTKGLLRPGMTVVDIGANIGYYVLLESKIVGPQGQIIAIEPEPYNFALLEKNVLENDCPNVRLVNAAIDRESGFAQLYLGNSPETHSLLKREKDATVMSVKSITLDELVANEEKVDFVRMDIEGYECEAIYGMIETIRQHRPILMIELHPNEVGKRKIVGLLDMVQKEGYQLRETVHRYMDYAGPVEPPNMLNLDMMGLVERIQKGNSEPYHVVFS